MNKQVPDKMNKFLFAAVTTMLSVFPIAGFSAGSATEGQAKSEVCHACHGATGIGTQPIYPNLAGQQQDYMSKALHDYRDGSRQDPLMNGFAGGLSDDDIEDLTAWYASQQGLTEIREK